jgi:hypothetical protein
MVESAGWKSSHLRKSHIKVWKIGEVEMQRKHGQLQIQRQLEGEHALPSRSGKT